MARGRRRTAGNPEPRRPPEDRARPRSAIATAPRLHGDWLKFRLWRPVGELRSVGVWRADDEADPRERVLGTLPLWPWMTAEITALQPHPNDPGPTEGEDR
ncbi:muconolactone Delta-isomerase family protein [Streptomyces flaveolus]|uniref:muconolactone Delta-isomerase family protein n=1 Tax=Streptomyces flaveolus TaxID=67297 RepID=UPI00343DE486